MKTQTERFAEISPTVIDGERWYRCRSVCMILWISAEMMRDHVPKKYTLSRTEARQKYRGTKVAYINREGIELLAIRYARCGRAAVMAALQ